MNRAVDFHSGPFMTADATWPIQLSPTVIEKPLCWLSAVSAPPGVTTEKLASFPAFASLTNCGAGTLSLVCLVSRHSAKDGQMSQPYPMALFPEAGCLGWPYIRQDRLFASRRSMIVGMWLAGVASNAPPFASPREKSGIQPGIILVVPCGDTHGVILSELQPHPGCAVTPLRGTGLSPVKRSNEPATAYRWPPQDGLSFIENVSSLM